MENANYQKNNMIKNEETNLNPKNKLMKNKIERNNNFNSNSNYNMKTERLYDKAS